jgi:hypothetical protein
MLWLVRSSPANHLRSIPDDPPTTPRNLYTQNCYAEDMNAEYARWDITKHQYDSQWPAHYPEAPAPPPPASLPFAFPEQPIARLVDGVGQLQLGKAHSRTSPVATRSRVTRHGSNPNPTRPSSSGAEANMVPFRSFAPPRRSESYSHPTPLEDSRKSRRWPPNGYRQDDALSEKEAEDLICAGASTFKGYWDAIPNAPPGYDRFYAVMDSEHQSRTDRGPFQHEAYREMTLNMTGASDSQFPWLSQEQPCMAYAFGKSAGTTTLNYCVSKSGSSAPPANLTGDAKLRKIKLLQILDRLQKLESGLNEDVSSPSASDPRPCLT